jgi:hypothetical protein
VEPDTWTKSTACETAQCIEVVVWRKSTRSTSDLTCVEVGIPKKSSFSDASGPWCVEVEGAKDGDVLVRDTKDPGPVLKFTPAEWRAFIAGAKLGEFDYPS